MFGLSMKTLRRMVECAVMLVMTTMNTAQADDRPNIVWIISEDASSHIAPYGETTIKTPNLDRLTREGVLFNRAYVTSPVCSPSRSALMTGMYPSSFGAHNHRSQRVTGKGGGNVHYYDSYKLPAEIALIPLLFREHGYFVVNSGKSKTDYNFQPNGGFYDGDDWTGRKDGQPFFAQIQLAGGKNRKANVSNPVNPDDVNLPPHYPDLPEMRKDWASYLDSWQYADAEIGRVLRKLEQQGQLNNTAIFFLTDHGISHIRGKQFLYEEGTRIPMIVRLPYAIQAGTIRDDLVLHIDIVATSLALAGIEPPANLHARDLFAAGHVGREHVIAERDRCDETVDIIRSVTTQRYKYIRNFLPHLPHAQANQYKDGKKILQVARKAHAAGELAPITAGLFEAPRPFEELYDLQNDPHELNNLATEPEHASTVHQLREILRSEMIARHDLGLIPESILEGAGGSDKSKYEKFSDESELAAVYDVFDAWLEGDLAALKVQGASDSSAVRYQALTALGVLGDTDARDLTRTALSDDSPDVRIAAALALLGPEVFATASDTINTYRNTEYEFTKRIAQRMSESLPLAQ